MNSKCIISLIAIFLIFSPAVKALDNSYVSPESYAVNEADLDRVFREMFPSQPVKQTEIINHEKSVTNKTSKKPQKVKKSSTKTKKETYKTQEKVNLNPNHTFKGFLRQLRYNTQNPHHGEKHEIKTKVREEYEKQQLEKQNNNENL